MKILTYGITGIEMRWLLGKQEFTESTTEGSF